MKTELDMHESPEGSRIEPTIDTLNAEGILAVEQPHQGFFGRNIKRYGIPAAAAMALVISACAIRAGAGEGTEIVLTTPTPSVSGPVASEVIPTVTVTPEAKPTATPEAKKDVPCQILPTEYCSGGQRLIVDIEGEKYTYMGFKLPVGTPLYSPIDGSMSGNKEAGDPFKGSVALIYDGNIGSSLRKTASFKGALKFQNDVMYKLNVKKGEQIATVAEGEGVGDYNLAFITAQSTPNGFEYDEIKDMFPEAFTKPPVSIDQVHPGKATIIVVPRN